MFDENGNPIAQDTEPVAEAPQQQESTVSPGVQSRIDELTAKLHDQQRQAAERDAQLTQLLAQLTAQQGREAVRQAPQEPAIEIDPEEQRKIDYVMSQRLKPIEEYTQRLEQQLISQQFKAYESQVPAEVLQRAQALKLAWLRSGKQGWVEEDAITYAVGEYNRKQSQQGQARQAQRAANAPANNVTMGVTAPAPSNNVSGGLPKNINEMPLEERLKAAEQYFANQPWED